jgi:thymidine kinase
MAAEMAQEATSNSDLAGCTGRLEVICGCMFSGKTERLIERLRAARREGQLVAAFKHMSDRRYSNRNLASHSHQEFPAEPVTSAAEIRLQAGQARVVAIDDGQFFDEDLVAVCVGLRQQGRRVIVAGLDRDCWSKPFHPVPDVAAVADDVVQTQGICASCGQPADRTYRHAPVVAGGDMVGGPEAYEPRCARCFNPPLVIEATRRC